MLRDIFATNAWSVTTSWFFYTMISSVKCHCESHDKFWLKQNNISVTSSTVMIRGESQTVVAIITFLETLCATNSWSVILRHFVSVIIKIVMRDMWCLRVVPRYKIPCSLPCLTRPTIKPDRARNHAYFAEWYHSPSIFQECYDYHGHKTYFMFFWLLLM